MDSDTSAIQFSCPSCNHKVRVPPVLAGTEGKCPACGTVFRAPNPSTSQSPMSRPPPTTGIREVGRLIGLLLSCASPRVVIVGALIAWAFHACAYVPWYKMERSVVEESQSTRGGELSPASSHHTYTYLPVAIERSSLFSPPRSHSLSRHWQDSVVDYYSQIAYGHLAIEWFSLLVLAGALLAQSLWTDRLRRAPQPR